MPFSEKLKNQIEEFKKIEPKERRYELIKRHGARKQAAMNLALDGLELEEISEKLNIGKPAVSSYIDEVIFLSDKHINAQLEAGSIWKNSSK